MKLPAGFVVCVLLLLSSVVNSMNICTQPVLTPNGLIEVSAIPNASLSGSLLMVDQEVSISRLWDVSLCSKSSLGSCEEDSYVAQYSALGCEFHWNTSTAEEWSWSAQRDGITTMFEGFGQSTDTAKLRVTIVCNRTMTPSVGDPSLVFIGGRLRSETEGVVVELELSSSVICFPQPTAAPTPAPPLTPSPTTHPQWTPVSIPLFVPQPDTALSERYEAQMTFDILPLRAEDDREPVDFATMSDVATKGLLAALEQDLQRPLQASHTEDGSINGTLSLSIFSTGNRSGVQVQAMTKDGRKFHEVVVQLHQSQMLLQSFQRMYGAFVGQHVVQMGSLSQFELSQATLSLELVDSSLHATQDGASSPDDVLESIRHQTVVAALTEDVAVAAKVPLNMVMVDTLTRIENGGSRLVAASLMILDTTSAVDAGRKVRAVPTRVDLPRTSTALQALIAHSNYSAVPLITSVYGYRADRAPPLPKHGSSCGDGCLTPVIISCTVFGLTLVIVYIAFGGETETSVEEYATGLAEQQHEQETAAASRSVPRGHGANLTPRGNAYGSYPRPPN